jgi:hypothetical protein
MRCGGVTRRRHALLTLPVAALASLAVAAPASADTLLAAAPGARNVAYGGGYVAWAAPESDGFRLVVRAPDGAISTPDIPPFASAPDPSIGSTSFAIGGRRLLLLYARQDASGDSDVYAYDLRRGGPERRVTGLSSDRYDESAPSMAFGRYAVVRAGGRVNGVVTGTLARPAVRRLSNAIASETAINASRVAYATRSGVIVRRASGKGRALTIAAPGAHSLALTRYQAAWLLPNGRLQLTQRFAGSGGPYQLVVRDAPRQPAGITSFATGASFNNAVFVDAEGVRKAEPPLFR